MVAFIPAAARQASRRTRPGTRILAGVQRAASMVIGAVGAVSVLALVLFGVALAGAGGSSAAGGFAAARGLRMYRVRERSMVLRVNGVDRIISFTGEELPRAGHPLRNAGMQAILAVPHLGTIVDWTTTAARRLKPGSTGPEAIAAATHWRQVLERAAARPPGVP
jgi:hypothetical protein